MRSELVVVELVGTPGSGKTTIAAEIVAALRARGVHADTIVNAARTHVARTRLGALAAHLPGARVRSLALWRLFLLFGFVDALRFAARNSGLVAHVAWARWRCEPAARRTRAGLWFLRLCGRLTFLARTAQPGEVVVLDDGFLHRAVHLHATPGRLPNLHDVAHYVERTPSADVTVHVVAPVDTCLARIRERGVWDHSKDLLDVQLAAYVRHARAVTDAAVASARRLGSSVIAVQNPDGARPAALVDDAVDTTLRLVGRGTASETTPHPRTRTVVRLPRPSRVTAQLTARLGPPVLEPAVVAEVLRRYDLGRENTGFRNLRLGRRSTNAVVHTHAGLKVVKRYRPQWTEATVAQGHSVLEHLEATGFPSVRLTRTRRDATWAVLDGDVYAVFDFVDGATYSMTYLRRRDRLALTAAAGVTLARFHEALWGFEPEGAHHLGFVSADGPRRRDVAWHAAKVDELTRRSVWLDPDAAPLGELLVRRAGELVDEIARLESDLTAVPLPRVVIHGDYGLHNLVFRTPTDAVVVDFESAHLDWRLNEVVSVVGKHRLQHGDRYDDEAIATLLAAYTARCPITDVELDVLPAVWRLHRLRAAVQYWNSYFETGGPKRKLHSALDALALADRLRRDPDLVAGVRAAAGATRATTRDPATRPHAAQPHAPGAEVGAR